MLGGIEVRLNEGHQVGNVLAEEGASHLLHLKISGHRSHEEEPGRVAGTRIGDRLEHGVVAGSRTDEPFHGLCLASFVFLDHLDRAGIRQSRPEVLGHDEPDFLAMLRRSAADPNPDRLRVLDEDEASTASEAFRFAVDLNAVTLLGHLASNDKEPGLRSPAVAPTAEVDGHFAGPEVEERGGLRTLDDSDLRPALAVELDGHQGGGAFLGDAGLAALPEEVGPALAADGDML